MKTSISIILILLGFSSCNNQAETGHNSQKTENGRNKSLLVWSKMKDKFPNQDIHNFDFDNNGHPKNDINKAIKLDSLTFNELVKKVKRYNDWKEYLEIYYFSKNVIDRQETGIFLVKKEFDGTEYTFDLIQLGENGEVRKIETLANSWTAAECHGYMRAKFKPDINQLYQEILQNCYDEKAENNESIDSIIILTSLKNLEFKRIKVDTIE